MKFTREQVIEMRKKADAYACSQTNDLYDFGRIAVSRLCTLAADAALEAAALECEKYDSLRIDGAGETIRDLKEKA